MNLEVNGSPRSFTVGNVTIQDCGKIKLRPDEMVTFVTESEKEFDFTRKDWGYYATPSLNGRLTQFGLRAALVRSLATHRYYVLVVESGMEDKFENYLSEESSEVVLWLDTSEALETLRKRIT